MSTNSFRLRYLLGAAAGVPRDVANSLILSRLRPVRPTVLVYNCTFVCDARCQMCSNWRHGDRRSDLTPDQLERVMSDRFWGAVENLNISGGEPTTRRDLPELVELFQRRLPRLRKIGINTTGLSPHLAIPLLTRVVEFCARKDILVSVRVSLDGIGEVHDRVRGVKNGFSRACETIDALQALAAAHANAQFGLATTLYSTNLDDAGNILAWARARKLDIVFNMLRFTDSMLNNSELREQVGLGAREEAFIRQFFFDRVAEESVFSGQAFMYLHYAEMLGNGYRRTMPCPFQNQGLLLNPDGSLFYCENSDRLGNTLEEPARELYFRASNLAARAQMKHQTCATCLSPCQVNVGAMKQVAPYVRFLRRARRVKRASARRQDAPSSAQ
jgi:MoaA/NifB/PqqE/SkfB family radical SAM enzyme